VFVGANVIHPASGIVDENATVVMSGREILAEGPAASTAVPPRSTVIDAHGKWIVPGYVDTHVHFFQSAGYYTRPDVADLTSLRPYPAEVASLRSRLHTTFEAWLASGVTTVVDMGGTFWNFDVREESRRVSAAPDVLTTGPLLSTSARPQLAVAGDPPIIEVSTDAEAEQLALREIARKPDFLKFWFIHRPNDDLAAQERLIRRVALVAHAHGLRLAVHATHLELAKVALRAGADMLVHSVDEELDDEFIALARAAHATYMPTLAVMGDYASALSNRWRPTPDEQRFGDPATLADLGPLDALPPEALPDIIKSQMAEPTMLAAPSAVQKENLRRMWKEGFLVTVGTDAGNIGTIHGPSYFRELALMSDAGLSNADLLRAATSNGAKLIGREKSQGDVRAGMTANLLVLRDNPLADVKNFASIDRVIRGGQVFERETFAHH
jgi:imidazolonepropionase-like amidohydrolase